MFYTPSSAFLLLHQYFFEPYVVSRNHHLQIFLYCLFAVVVEFRMLFIVATIFYYYRYLFVIYSVVHWYKYRVLNLRQRILIGYTSKQVVTSTVLILRNWKWLQVQRYTVQILVCLYRRNSTEERYREQGLKSNWNNNPEHCKSTQIVHIHLQLICCYTA